MRLALDPPYANLLNAGNVSNLNGHLQTEAICQTPIQNADAARACEGFKGSVVVPPDGTHVQITGTYLLDKNHGWMEIHPISVLRISPQGARAWRNNTDAPLYFLCVQYRANSVIEGGGADGQKAEGKLAWSN